jgi:hypothetical protein
MRSGTAMQHRFVKKAVRYSSGCRMMSEQPSPDENSDLSSIHVLSWDRCFD